MVAVEENMKQNTLVMLLVGGFIALYLYQRSGCSGSCVDDPVDAEFKSDMRVRGTCPSCG